MGEERSDSRICVCEFTKPSQLVEIRSDFKIKLGDRVLVRTLSGLYSQLLVKQREPSIISEYSYLYRFSAVSHPFSADLSLGILTQDSQFDSALRLLTAEKTINTFFEENLPNNSNRLRQFLELITGSLIYVFVQIPEWVSTKFALNFAPPRSFFPNVFTARRHISPRFPLPSHTCPSPPFSGGT